MTTIRITSDASCTIPSSMSVERLLTSEVSFAMSRSSTTATTIPEIASVTKAAVAPSTRPAMDCPLRLLVMVCSSQPDFQLGLKMVEMEWYRAKLFKPD